jgi:hypothetical protein
MKRFVGCWLLVDFFFRLPLPSVLGSGFVSSYQRYFVVLGQFDRRFFPKTEMVAARNWDL